jgi:hypothetical protein
VTAETQSHPKLLNVPQFAKWQDSTSAQRAELTQASHKQTNKPTDHTMDAFFWDVTPGKLLHIY